MSVQRQPAVTSADVPVSPERDVAGHGATILPSALLGFDGEARRAQPTGVNSRCNRRSPVHNLGEQRFRRNEHQGPGGSHDANSGSATARSASGSRSSAAIELDELNDGIASLSRAESVGAVIVP